uniref:Uncharacterized protein n=1 Tax=Solanum lycopersicum TaxID=4081 RepID=A0A3Q7GT19_SOLLC
MGTLSPPHSQFIFHIFTLFFLISLNHYDSQAMSTITAMAKDQLSCTMCSSCDNTCQPISPPPPPPQLYPPSSSGYICPPPPPVYVSPPNNSGGNNGGEGDANGSGNYPPPTNNYPTPPPPNPIVPYFPFYFHSPPPPTSKSIHLERHPLVTCLIFGVAIFFLL